MMKNQIEKKLEMEARKSALGFRAALGLQVFGGLGLQA